MTTEQLKKLTTADLLQQEKKIRRGLFSLRSELTAVKIRIRDLEAQQFAVRDELDRRGM